MQKSKRLKTILIIDDNEEVRNIIQKVLESAGYSVLSAGNIQDALELANEHIPHLIILDLVMPEKGGFEFLEIKKQLTKLAHIPVLVASVLKNKESIYRAVKLGTNDYLIKPIDARILIQKVRKAFREKAPLFVSYPKNAMPVTQAHVNSKILLANETGFFIESPIKLAASANVNIQSDLLKKFACTTCVFQRTQNDVKMVNSSTYVNEVSIVGLSSTIMDRIHNTVKEWK
jgi:two-component system chemotaxis response regulator CheY